MFHSFGLTEFRRENLQFRQQKYQEVTAMASMELAESKFVHIDSSRFICVWFRSAG